MTTVYAINDIYHCIQGEGCQTGMPMVLVRLHGCPVHCPWCDTKETWEEIEHLRTPELAAAMGQSPWWAKATPEQIIDHIKTHVLPKDGADTNGRWVLLTGGEPAEQQLGPLVEALHAEGFMVAIETSGTATGHVNAGIDWVCVSPKIGMPGGRQVQTMAMMEAHEIKMVVAGPRDIARLQELLEDCKTGDVLSDGVQVCLQPVSQNAAATRLCVETCKQHNWRLSIQTHKYLELP